MAVAVGIEKLILSGSTSAKGTKVAATATPGTLIHTVHATNLEEVFLWAYNGHTADVVLTLEWGGVAVPDDNIVLTVPTKDGLHLVAPGLLLTGGLVVRAFAATTNVITLHGFANQIT
jgi:hypothetical protein